ncbi:hypothetical protein EVAR_21189_1 [Eumeta japonica]|uniref:HAT C-terminal dimerisation domain-containing protein n=1 Tax=Eumeta variegata TaxID=151549 RepID=A0A4C1UNZ8_EUMVA|nr:hypothetical protein EVAR_21189_1 [Eumeta japonica]
MDDNNDDDHLEDLDCSESDPEIQVQNESGMTNSIRREMSLFENGGVRGYYLETAYMYLMSIPPTSVEPERAFSAAAYVGGRPCEPHIAPRAEVARTSETAIRPPAAPPAAEPDAPAPRVSSDDVLYRLVAAGGGRQAAGGRRVTSGGRERCPEQSEARAPPDHSKPHLKLIVKPITINKQDRARRGRQVKHRRRDGHTAAHGTHTRAPAINKRFLQKQSLRGGELSFRSHTALLSSVTHTRARRSAVDGASARHTRTGASVCREGNLYLRNRHQPLACGTGYLYLVERARLPGSLGAPQRAKNQIYSRCIHLRIVISTRIDQTMPQCAHTARALPAFVARRRGRSQAGCNIDWAPLLLGNIDAHVA